MLLTRWRQRGELTPHLLAAGLKMAFVDPLFGLFVFILARIGIIILVALEKKNQRNLTL